jgi:hypothetical protein
MGDTRKSYRNLVGNTEGKVPLSTPRRKWKKYIKMNLRKLGFEM